MRVTTITRRWLESSAITEVTVINVLGTLYVALILYILSIWCLGMVTIYDMFSGLRKRKRKCLLFSSGYFISILSAGIVLIKITRFWQELVQGLIKRPLADHKWLVGHL